MSRSRDPYRLDDQTAARLLEGRAHPSEVSPAYASVAAVMAAAAAPPAPGEAGYAAAMATRLAAVAAASRPRRRPGRLFSRSRIVVVALAGLLVVTGGLGAAGALPDAAQRVARTVFESVGIHVRPGPDPHAGIHPFERGKSGKTKTHIPGRPTEVPGNPSPGTPSGKDERVGRGQSGAPGVSKPKPS
jgi:hypothetical protein